MLTSVLIRAGLDPSYLIGGDLNETGGGAGAGRGEAFVFEADESDGSFLLGSPAIGVITNVDVDHIDFYPGGRDEIEHAFARFAAGCAVVVACGDDEGAGRALSLAGVDPITYGLWRGSRYAVRVEHLGPDGARGTVTVDGENLALSLRIDGAHNLLDATAAIATAHAMGVEPAVAADALASFGGVHRRFELRGRARDAEFFDDYGLTPTEMEVTIDTARRRRPGRLIALVQPHRYWRVQALWRELGGFCDCIPPRHGRRARASVSIAISAARASSAVLTGCGNARRTGRGPSAVLADISNPYRSMPVIGSSRRITSDS